MTNSTNRPVKPWLWLGVTALLVVAILGHWFFWYAPRARSGSPGTEAPTARMLFGEGDLPLRLWIPFPHQNLAALERAFGDLDGWTEVSSYLISEDLALLPSFGPFRLPPARDLVVRGSQEGDRLVVAATVYPLVARLARVAGWLADNPWLAGGSIESQGRNVRVQWQEGTWMATQGDVALGGPRPVPKMAPSHALLSLEEPYGPVPEGLYRLDVGGEGWRITSAEAAAQDIGAAATQALPPTLALVAASTSSSPAQGTISRVLAMPAGVEGVGEQVTSTVVAQRGGGERWQLPTERLFSGLGFEVAETVHGEWTAAAFDQVALREVTDQLVHISALIDAVEDPPLILGLWLDVAPARRALDDLVRAIDSLPIPKSEQVRRWIVAAKALSCVGSEGALQVEITGSPPLLRAQYQGPGTD